MEAPSLKFLEKSVVRTLGLLHSRKMVAGGGTAIMLHVSYSARSRNAAILCRVYFLGDTHQKRGSCVVRLVTEISLFLNPNRCQKLYFHKNRPINSTFSSR
jgi:hypothetical protein